MVTHLSYDEATYRDAAACLEGIRRHLDHGWSVLQLRGPRDGPYLVLFKMEDCS